MKGKEAKILPVGIVLDVDEVEFNSAERHHQWLIEYGHKVGWENMPDYHTMLELGGSHGAFGDFPGYWDLNGSMRFNPDFNTDLDLIPDSQEVINQFATFVLFYLTTRPDKLNELTRNELVKYDFPDRQVYTRPKEVPLEMTAEWKRDFLIRKAEELNQVLILIDDSASTVKAIKQANHPLVKAILHKGPITKDQVEYINEENGQQVILRSRSMTEIQRILRNIFVPI